MTPTRAHSLDHVVAHLTAQRDLPTTVEGWLPSVALDDAQPRVEFQWFVPAAATVTKLSLPKGCGLLRVRAGVESAEKWVRRGDDVSHAARVVVARLVVALESRATHLPGGDAADAELGSWLATLTDCVEAEREACERIRGFLRDAGDAVLCHMRSRGAPAS